MKIINLSEKFSRYDRENPNVYAAFKNYAYLLLNAGRKYAGAKLIMERLRWDTMIGGSREDGMPLLKINNNYAAFYARKLMAEDQRFEGFFALREQKSATDVSVVAGVSGAVMATYSSSDPT